MKKCPDCGAHITASQDSCPSCGKALVGETSGLIGATVAEKYLIEESVGSGGMCDVYKARHVAMGKQVAIKVLRPSLAADAKIVERFGQEARAASRIHHPHAINVTDYGIAGNGLPFIIMDYVNGRTLGEVLRGEGAMGIERAANILRQVCGALDAAHAVGVIHRDIKPDNILLAEYDESDWVEVVDFGVAKIQEDVKRSPTLTGANVIVGTPRYMSPEQCDERPIDNRSDIYSLGVVLYEMLTGEAPFPGNSSTRLLMAHVASPPPPLRQKRPDLSPEIEAIVMRALEKDPSLRPQSAEEFSREFERAAGLGQPARAWADRGGFSRISVPLGDEKPSPVADDEVTIVRKREGSQPPAAGQTSPLDDQSLQYDPYPINNAQAQYADSSRQRTPAHVTTYVAPSSRDEGRSGNGLIIAVTLVLLGVAGVAAWMVFGDRIMGSKGGADPIIYAQQAVTDALARVDSLPRDHALRSYLPQLSAWQGELRAYQQVGDYSPQVLSRAEQYQRKAQDISDQARMASATLPRNSAESSTSNTQAPKPATLPEGEGADKSAEADESDPGEEPQEDEQKRQDNTNRNTQRRSEPPVLDPVKPVPPQPKPSNSNRPRNDPPPPM